MCRLRSFLAPAVPLPRLTAAALAIGLAANTSAAPEGLTDGQLAGYLAGELRRAGVMIAPRDLTPHVFDVLVARVVAPRDPEAAMRLREAARGTDFEK